MTLKSKPLGQFWPHNSSVTISLTAGYNHPALLSAFSSPESVSILANRPALGVYPGQDWATQLRAVLLSAAPPGLDQVTTMMCGSCSNENAFKLMHFKVSRDMKGSGRLIAGWSFQILK